MVTSLLPAKYSIPPTPRGLVRRARLLDRLDESCQRKLTLVSAPAGYGKTTLLATWAASSRRGVAWLSLDERDNDPPRFWAYLVAALSRLHPGGEAAPAAAPGPSEAPLEVLAEVASSAITAIPGEFCLVLDDYHLINNPALHRAVSYLLDYSPTGMHMVIAGREDPPLPLALLRGHDQLVELRAAELSFTVAEATAFLRRVPGLDLPVEALQALHGRTEGWAAGLQLAALSMRGQADAPALVQSFAGTHRYIVDYLAEQVLAKQDPALQRFLLETSILDRLSGPLCDAVTGYAGGQAALERLERANLFLVPLDDERRWYRYHQLFADFLRDRLRLAEPDHWSDLHRTAARQMELQGDLALAFEHWMTAGDYQEAARLATGAAKDLVKRGEVRLLLGRTERLPGQVVRENPQLGVFHAWALALTGQMVEMEAYLRDLEQRMADGAVRAAAREAGLPGEIAALRAYQAIQRGDTAHARALGEAALALLPADEESTRSVVYLTLAIVARLSSELQAMVDALQEAADHARKAGNLHAALPAAHDLAEVEMQRGCLRRAHEILRGGACMAVGPDGHPLPTSAQVHAGMADILYQWNDLEGAAHLAELAATLSRRWGFLEAILRGYRSLLWVSTAQGDIERAQVLVYDGDALVRQGIVLPTTHSRWVAETLRWWIGQGQHARAGRIAQERGLAIDAEITYLNAREHACLARLLLVRGRIDEALRHVARLLKTARATRQAGRMIELYVLQALVLQACGEGVAAKQTLARALALAEPEGYVRVFVDEGQPLAGLLRELRGQAERVLLRGETDHAVTPAYIERLLSAFPDKAGQARSSAANPSALLEPVNERETQVLHLIAAGKTYQEIARELVIAVSTVQTHVKNLYPKLGVHSGLEAVARARRIGLLPP